MAEIIAKQKTFEKKQKKLMKGIDFLLEWSEESKEPILIMFAGVRFKYYWNQKFKRKNHCEWNELLGKCCNP